jgi:hypothetical protein
MDPQLQELLDKKACEEVLMRYGRTLDWLDEAGQASCFWPDADVDYGFFAGSGADWVTTVMPIEQASSRRWHSCSGVLVTVDGEQAKSECYGLTVGTGDNGDGVLMDSLFGGRYLDELQKRDGEWRISKRRYILDWTQQLPGGLDAHDNSKLLLKVLQISEPGHEMYRPL